MAKTKQQVDKTAAWLTLLQAVASFPFFWVFLGIVLVLSQCDKTDTTTTTRSNDSYIVTEPTGEEALHVKNGIIIKPLVVCVTAEAYINVWRSALSGDLSYGVPHLQNGECIEFKPGLHIKIIERSEFPVVKVRIENDDTHTVGYTLYYFIAKE